MAYTNFCPTVWEEHIETELDRECKYAEDCYTVFEGKVREIGESVKFTGLGDPTIKTTYKKDQKELDEPEDVEDLSILMPINVLSTFNYKVDDIDKIQAEHGIEGVLSKRTTVRLASEIDKYIANRALSKDAIDMFDGEVMKVTTDNPVEGEVNVLRVLNRAATSLYKNDVPYEEEIVANVSPEFYDRYIWALGGRATDNMEILKKGRVSRYGNILVKASNNIAVDKNGADRIMVRTKQAIGYARTHIHTEAYRPEKSFADAIKGFVLYDSKVLRPKEMITFSVTY